MPTYNKRERNFIAKEIGETRINGTNGNTEYWSGDNYGWQSQNGHTEALAKEKARADSAIDKPLWDAVDNGTETVGTFVASLPVVKEIGGAIHYVGEKLEETAANDAANGNGNSLANIAVNGASGWRQSVEWFGNGARTNYRAAEFLIEGVTGLELDDRGRDRYAGALQFAGEEIATFGAGKLASKAKDLSPPAPKPVPVGVAIQDGSLVLKKPTKSLDNTINPITVSPGWRANPDVKEGVAGRVKGELTERRMRLAEIEANRVRQNAKGSKGANRRAKTLTDRAASTLPDLADDDPVAYGRRAFTEPDPDRPGFVMDQHHLFGKAQSAPFAQKMDELIAAGVAHEDDLVALAEWGKKLEAVMGDRLSNVLNAPKAIHVGEGGIHPTMRKAGLEPKTKDVQALLANAKNADDVMAAFNDYVLTYVKPSQKMAREMTEDYLKRKSEFSAPEQTMMENFLNDLRQRGS